MITQTIGLLHPGKMGAFIAAMLKQSGHRVLWASEARGVQTRERAEEVGLEELITLATLCDHSDILVSVCPPHAAEAVAHAVAAHAFGGLYLDANAISPQKAERIGEYLLRHGISLVDGGIIGGPAWESGQTHLCLSGPHAQQIASLFNVGALRTTVVGEEIGQASALKMCYAAYNKGTTALLCAILATAEALGVRDELMAQWSEDWPGFAEQSEARVRRVTAKAWRFAGEMEEIAATFEGVGVPGGFYDAAETLYHRLAGYKDSDERPTLDEVLASLVERA